MKDIIRKKLLEIRNNIPYSEVLEKSYLIEKNIFNTKEFKKSKNILFYVSYNNEVNTHNMIKKTLILDKNIIVPISNVENKSLILSKLEKWDDLKKSTYNILEPKINEYKEVSLDIIDLIIVPGVAFDISGNRIGHGLGYYDKLLKKSNKSALIGLAFEFQIINNIITEKHDIPVDKIITELRIINCKK